MVFRTLPFASFCTLPR